MIRSTFFAAASALILAPAVSHSDGDAGTAAKLEFRRNLTHTALIYEDTLLPGDVIARARQDAETLGFEFVKTLSAGNAVLVKGSEEDIAARLDYAEDLPIAMHAPVYAFEGSLHPDRMMVLSSELRLEFERGVTETAKAAWLASQGLQKIKEYPDGSIMVESGQAPDDALFGFAEKLEQTSIVADAMVDFTFSVELLTRDSLQLQDHFLYTQWPLDNSGFNGDRFNSIRNENQLRTLFPVGNDQDIDAGRAWMINQWLLDNDNFNDRTVDSPFGSSEIVVAVLDTGTQTIHEDLAENIDSRVGSDFIDGAEPTPSLTTLGLHGTIMASIIAADDNDRGILGVAPDVTIYSSRVFESDTSTNLSGVLAAIGETNLRDIDINLHPYALPFVFNPAAPNTQIASSIENALEQTFIAGRDDRGAINIAAAGNFASQVQYPASSEFCIAVGSVDANGDPLVQSNWAGAGVDIVMPGIQAAGRDFNAGSGELLRQGWIYTESGTTYTDFRGSSGQVGLSDTEGNEGGNYVTLNRLPVTGSFQSAQPALFLPQFEFNQEFIHFEQILDARFGTSISAAYAAGVTAMLLSDERYQDLRPHEAPDVDFSARNAREYRRKRAPLRKDYVLTKLIEHADLPSGRLDASRDSFRGENVLDYINGYNYRMGYGRPNPARFAAFFGDLEIRRGATNGRGTPDSIFMPEFDGEGELFAGTEEYQEFPYIFPTVDDEPLYEVTFNRVYDLTQECTCELPEEEGGGEPKQDEEEEPLPLCDDLIAEFELTLQDWYVLSDPMRTGKLSFEFFEELLTRCGVERGDGTSSDVFTQPFFGPAPVEIVYADGRPFNLVDFEGNALPDDGPKQDGSTPMVWLDSAVFDEGGSVSDLLVNTGSVPFNPTPDEFEGALNQFWNPEGRYSPNLDYIIASPPITLNDRLADEYAGQPLVLTVDLAHGLGVENATVNSGPVGPIGVIDPTDNATRVAYDKITLDNINVMVARNGGGFETVGVITGDSRVGYKERLVRPTFFDKAEDDHIENNIAVFPVDPETQRYEPWVDDNEMVVRSYKFVIPGSVDLETIEIGINFQSDNSYLPSFYFDPDDEVWIQLTDVKRDDNGFMFVGARLDAMNVAHYETAIRQENNVRALESGAFPNWSASNHDVLFNNGFPEGNFATGVIGATDVNAFFTPIERTGPGIADLDYLNFLEAQPADPLVDLGERITGMDTHPFFEFNVVSTDANRLYLMSNDMLNKYDIFEEAGFLPADTIGVRDPSFSVDGDELIFATDTGVHVVALNFDEDEYIPRPSATFASASIGITGLNKISFSAVEEGPGGNDISVEFRTVPEVRDLAVNVNGQFISVVLGTNETGASISTAADVVAAINLNDQASALVSAVAINPSGVVNPALRRFLNGGSSKFSVETPVRTGDFGLREFRSPVLTEAGGRLLFSARSDQYPSLSVYAANRQGRLIYFPTYYGCEDLPDDNGGSRNLGDPLLVGWGGADLYDLELSFVGERLLFVSQADAFPLSPDCYRQSELLGEDDGADYPDGPLTNGDQGGAGFEPWQISFFPSDNGLATAEVQGGEFVFETSPRIQEAATLPSGPADGLISVDANGDLLVLQQSRPDIKQGETFDLRFFDTTTPDNIIEVGSSIDDPNLPLPFTDMNSVPQLIGMNSSGDFFIYELGSDIEILGERAGVAENPVDLDASNDAAIVADDGSTTPLVHLISLSASPSVTTRELDARPLDVSLDGALAFVLTTTGVQVFDTGTDGEIEVDGLDLTGLGYERFVVNAANITSTANADIYLFRPGFIASVVIEQSVASEIVEIPTGDMETNTGFDLRGGALLGEFLVTTDNTDGRAPGDLRPFDVSDPLSFLDLGNFPTGFVNFEVLSSEDRLYAARDIPDSTETEIAIYEVQENGVQGIRRVSQPVEAGFQLEATVRSSFSDPFSTNNRVALNFGDSVSLEALPGLENWFITTTIGSFDTGISKTEEVRAQVSAFTLESLGVYIAPTASLTPPFELEIEADAPSQIEVTPTSALFNPSQIIVRDLRVADPESCPFGCTSSGDESTPAIVANPRDTALFSVDNINLVMQSNDAPRYSLITLEDTLPQSEGPDISPVIVRSPRASHWLRNHYLVEGDSPWELFEGFQSEVSVSGFELLYIGSYEELPEGAQASEYNPRGFIYRQTLPDELVPVPRHQIVQAPGPGPDSGEQPGEPVEGVATQVDEFDFEQDAEGWIYGLAGDEFDAAIPSSGSVNGALTLTSPDSLNSFGYFETPRRRIRVRDNSLYLVRYAVQTGVSDVAMAPTLRLRVNSNTFENAYEQITNSIGDQSLAPPTTESVANRVRSQQFEDFDLLFRPADGITTLPPNDQTYTAAFDLLNFAEDDDRNGSLLLDQVEIYRLDEAGRNIALFNFRVPTAQAASVDFVVTGLGPRLSDLSMSVRTNCALASTDVDCVTGDNVQGISMLNTGLQGRTNYTLIVVSEYPQPIRLEWTVDGVLAPFDPNDPNDPDFNQAPVCGNNIDIGQLAQEGQSSLEASTFYSGDGILDHPSCLLGENATIIRSVTPVYDVVTSDPAVRAQWSSSDPAALSDFVSPEFISENSLAMRTLDPTNTFGFWDIREPIAIELPQEVIDRDFAVFRGLFTFSAESILDGAQVPSLRVRLSTADLQRTAVGWLSGDRSGVTTPVAGQPRTIEVYLVLEEIPANLDGLRVSYDMLAFRPTLSSQPVSLDAVRIELLDLVNYPEPYRILD